MTDFRNEASKASTSTSVTRRAFSIPEAAEALGISKSGLWALIRIGKVVPVRIGGRTLVTVVELDRLLGTPQATEGRHEH